MSIIKSSIATKQQRVEGGLAAFLDERCTYPSIVLHRRRVARSAVQFDHLVVAPSGVWVVQSERDLGRVERRDVGDWRTIDERLLVDGVDRTDLLDQIERQRRVVESVIAPLGYSDALIRRAVVFTRADWGMFTKPFAIDGVEVMWARALVPRLGAPGPMTALDIELVAHHLAAHLPPRTACTRGPMITA